MVNLSDTKLISSKENAITYACDQLGFSRSLVKQMFESAQVLEGEKFSTELFISKIEDVTKPKEIYSGEQFISSISTLFSEVALDGSRKMNYAEKFLEILNDYTNEKKIDSIGLINIANDVMRIKDLRNFTEVEKNLSLLYDNPKQLFEGLKEILWKNNSRWGSTYHLQNTYQTIMHELTKEVEDIQVSKMIHSVDNTYVLKILNDMLTGDVSPLHRHVSSVKQLVPSIQDLVFDMVLLVGKYMDSNRQALEFISRQTINSFLESGEDIVSKTISCSKNSQLLNSTGSICGSYENEKNVFIKMVQDAHDLNLKYNINNIPLKGVVDMLKFIASCSSDMHVSVRYGIRNFCTKGFELANKVEAGNRLLKDQTNKIF